MEIELVKKIFKECGFDITEATTRTEQLNLIYFDFKAQKDGVEYGVEVKISSSFNNMRVAHMLSSYCEKNNYKPVLVLLNVATDGLRFECQKFNIELVDISNLLAAVANSDLYSELVSCLSFSIDTIHPNESPLLINETLKHSNKAESLIKELDLISSGRQDFAKYEDWCSNVLIYLFDDKLALWERQERSNKDLYRFDLLCRIKDGEKDTFWRILENYFKSKYVIFEFKNYNDKITQDQIYTTEKYLYKKALRSVAFIIARSGFDENAKWAAKGCLRENGKLIILLDSNDIKEMINLKRQDDNPSGYLLHRLDGLLAELEK